MALYTFHDLTLELQEDRPEITEGISRLLQELSWARTHAPAAKPSLGLSVKLNEDSLRVLPVGREIFLADGFFGLEAGDDYYLTDGSCLFHLQILKRQGEITISSAFFSKPPLLQRKFWAFSLLKLLQCVGIYNLHAAGVITPEGIGLLIVGKSGSGKSTLAIGLTRQGWNYLSDDAVLLRFQPEGVEALASRKNFYVNADAASMYQDLCLAEEVPDTCGGLRRKVSIQDDYPSQYVAKCIPGFLFFSCIVPDGQSVLLPLDRFSALKTLLAQSGPQLFDRKTMPRHLDLLTCLLRQTATYELRAGSDLYHDPIKLVQLLAKAQERGDGRAACDRADQSM